MRIPLRIMLLLVCITTAHSSVFAQTAWKTYRDADTQFRFLHPPDWYFGKPRGPNVKATLFPPTDKPRANCNIVVQTLRETANTSQQDLNAEISESTLTAEDWKQMMGQKWPDYRVIESHIVKVDNQPAFYAIVEHSHQTVDRKTYIKGASLTTFTPGHTWFFGCAGKGDTRIEANDSFQYWKPTFERILGSLVFESRFDPANVETTATSGSLVQLGAYLLTTAAVIMIFWVIPGTIGAIIAKNKGRSAVGWFFFSAIFWLPIVIVIFLPPTKEVPGKYRECQSCREIVVPRRLEWIWL
jgi:hypothetical protein